MSELAPVIKVIEEKCVNCHTCISVCPVKFCIDGSGDKVIIDHDLCIGCGSCIRACTHHAREGIDDTEAFFLALERGEPMAAIVAPAIAARLGKDFLRLNGWLRKRGVKAVLDVAFGAELTVKSYLEHVKAANPKMVISQPCPAIVTYIQTWQPTLAKWLAPADSPMLHTIKMFREYNPALRQCKIAIISPCVAKRREFDETGLGDWNVTIEKLLAAFESKGIRLADFPEEGFDNPPAETAVLFSTPGGLKETVEREVPGLAASIRKVEGPETVYRYFEELEVSLEAGVNPLIVDCLNCEKGCNGGTGTGAQDVPVDIMERRIAERRRVQRERLAGPKPSPEKAARIVRRSIEKHWKPGLYGRTYADRSRRGNIKQPSEAEFREIYVRMRKEKEEDFLNCSACGYHSCEQMAVAIFNGLNQSQNCHHYQAQTIRGSRDDLRRMSMDLDREIAKASGMVGKIIDTLPELQEKSESESAGIAESAAMVQEFITTLRRTSELSSSGGKDLGQIAAGAKEGGRRMEEARQAIRATADRVKGIHEMVGAIDKIAAQTNLLSMNAAIEAAHAGDSGRGFAVVAEEIRRLSEQAASSAKEIGKTLMELVRGMSEAAGLSEEAGGSVTDIFSRVTVTAEDLEKIFAAQTEMATGSHQVNEALAGLNTSAGEVKVLYASLAEHISKVGDEIRTIARISADTINSTKVE